MVKDETEKYTGGEEVIANSPWVIRNRKPIVGIGIQFLKKRSRSILRWGWEKAVF